MKGIDIRICNSACIIMVLWLIVLPLKGQDLAMDAEKEFRTKFEQIEKEVEGTLGVAIMHIGTGEKITYRGEEFFPMASVFKIPVALQFLHLVDQKKISLDDSITITPSDFRPGSSLLATQGLPKGSLTLSNRELLELMLTHSDNTACDIILAMAGGPEAVTKRMRKLGLTGISVDRCIAELMCDYVGVMEEPEEKGWSFQLINDLFSTVTEESRKEAFYNFLNDPRDTATPEAIVGMLALISTNKALKLGATNLLLEIMEEAKTGNSRIKGLLPPEVEVAHKTGTSGTYEGINAATNDVGIVQLPGKAGKIAVAVFIKSSETELHVREQAIAKIARMAYDHWVANEQ